jgi:hypothetical protein
MIRILARADNPRGEAHELDWINSQVRLLGKSYVKAARDIQANIDAGIMIIVRIEKAQ